MTAHQLKRILASETLRLDVSAPIYYSTSSDARPLPRIFIDQSFTARSSLQTGVHRVVRSIARWLPTIYEGKVQAVVSSRDGFLPAESCRHSAIQRILTDLEASVLEHVPRPIVATSQLVCRGIRHRRVRGWLLPERGHLGIYRWPLRLAQGGHRLVSQRPKPIHVKAGDILLLPAAYWATEGAWKSIAAAREQGAYVCSLVYDLIPHYYPEFVIRGAQKSFRDYLVKLSEHSDHIVAISQTVRDQVEQVLPQIAGKRSRCRRFDSFELGADARANRVKKVSPEVRQAFGDPHAAGTYLMVATFEPRKNHQYILDAFEHIWVTNPLQKICLVGRVGWMCENILRSLSNHPRLGKQLFVFHDLTDSDVAYCYQNARAVIFPSIAEGFGLPIVEALSWGCYVFASDTQIHREVGGDSCFYSNLNDPGHLAKQILAWEKMHPEKTPRRPPSRRPLTWQESTTELLVHVLSGWDQYLSQCDLRFSEQRPLESRRDGWDRPIS